MNLRASSLTPNEENSFLVSMISALERRRTPAKANPHSIGKMQRGRRLVKSAKGAKCTAPEIDALRHRYMLGESVTSLARCFEISPRTVRRYLAGEA